MFVINISVSGSSYGSGYGSSYGDGYGSSYGLEPLLDALEAERFLAEQRTILKATTNKQLGREHRATSARRHLSASKAPGLFERQKV